MKKDLPAFGTHLSKNTDNLGLNSGTDTEWLGDHLLIPEPLSYISSLY